ncbi:MAG: VanZ family protein [Gemmatimonadaceae bacterium]
MTASARGRWIVAAGTLLIVVATLTPGTYIASSSRVCLVCGVQGGVDVILNVLLFLPLGVGLSQLRLRVPAALALILGTTLSIELLQVLVIPGRDASLGDVVMNSVGGLLGLYAGRGASGALRPSQGAAAYLAVAWLALWLAVQAAIGFTFTPIVPGPPYYGQIARPASAARSEFPGRVLSANVGPETLSKGSLQNAAQVRAMLGRPEGSLSEVMVIPAGPSAGRAEIVVISGPEMEGVLSFEQVGRSLVFGQRTGAEVLRLRPYEYRLSAAFDSIAESSRDTLWLRGSYTPSQVLVGATSRGDDRERRFVPRLSQGWIVLAPLPSYIDGDVLELAASAAFLILLVLPAGYWLMLATRPGADTARLRKPWLLAVCALVLSVGFVVVPRLFAMQPAALWEWGCVVTGALLGAVIARSLTPAPRDLAHGQRVAA